MSVLIAAKPHRATLPLMVSCLPSYINVVAGASTASGVLRVTVFPAREKALVITSVERHQHHLIALVKDGLRAISLVNVPVENEYLLALVCR